MEPARSFLEECIQGPALARFCACRVIYHPFQDFQKTTEEKTDTAGVGGEAQKRTWDNPPTNAVGKRGGGNHKPNHEHFYTTQNKYAQVIPNNAGTLPESCPKPPPEPAPMLPVGEASPLSTQPNKEENTFVFSPSRFPPPQTKTRGPKRGPASPRLASPRLASPRLASPRRLAVSPQVAGGWLVAATSLNFIRLWNVSKTAPKQAPATSSPCESVCFVLSFFFTT